MSDQSEQQPLTLAEQARADLGTIRRGWAHVLDPIAERGLSNVRAAIRTRPAHTTDTDPTRARAIERARQERTNAKEQQ